MKYPVAYLVPKLVTFKDLSVNPVESEYELLGTVAWTLNFSDNWPSITDKHGVLHSPTKLVVPEYDEAAADAAFDNTYHKIAAEVSRDTWDKIWKKAIESLKGNNV